MGAAAAPKLSRLVCEQRTKVGGILVFCCNAPGTSILRLKWSHATEVGGILVFVAMLGVISFLKLKCSQSTEVGGILVFVVMPRSISFLKLKWSQTTKNPDGGGAVDSQRPIEVGADREGGEDRCTRQRCACMDMSMRHK